MFYVVISKSKMPTEFVPKLFGLQKASLDGRAVPFLKTLPKHSRGKVINKIFKKYYKTLTKPQEQQRVVPLQQLDIRKYIDDHKVVLSQDGHDGFFLVIGDLKINIVLDNACVLEKYAGSGFINLHLAKRKLSSSILKEIEQIQKDNPNSRRRRSTLADLYKSLCLLHDTEPVMKYPRGTEEQYIELIKDISVRDIHLSV
jgi:hypothetical protein